jgi:hypothetical protein
MLRQTIKISLAILFSFGLTILKAQRTFQIDKSYLDSMSFTGYKSFIVSKKFDINFIGRKIPVDERFNLDTVQIKLTETAIETQYVNANVRQLDSQWAQMKSYKEAYDWDLAVKQHKEQRPKMLKAFKKVQQNDLHKYDRYLFGYLNDLGENIVLIRFDPHKIKYFTIAGEQHVSNLPIMTYNLKTKILSLAGWE